MLNTMKYSPLEVLRTSCTDLNQEEFCVYCGIPSATYRRMIKNDAKKIKLSPVQLAKLCLICNISGNELIARLTDG